MPRHARLITLRVSTFSAFVGSKTNRMAHINPYAQSMFATRPLLQCPRQTHTRSPALQQGHCCSCLERNSPSVAERPSRKEGSNGWILQLSFPTATGWIPLRNPLWRPQWSRSPTVVVGAKKVRRDNGQSMVPCCARSTLDPRCRRSEQR